MITSNTATAALALDITQLRKTYRSGVEALKGINLAVYPGDFFALLGVNGAGKSTTIGLISSLLTKTSGRIIINGYNLDTDAIHAKKSLGLVPQEFNLNIFETCEQILLNQAGYYGVPRAKAAKKSTALLNQLGLWDKRHQIVRYLSGGMKRRLMIARALVHEPKLLILDEPSAGVDIEIRRSIWAFLKQINADGTTIILTTHYLEEAEQLCNQVAIIDRGIIIENSSIKRILQSLNHQTYIFDTLEPIGELPQNTSFEMTIIDRTQFEIRVDNRYLLNDVFTFLDQHNIGIQSMRNKTNRLEELFLDRIQHEN
jgi:ABC-2 type transport system ATP-binding protein